jgi:hypothetical protein
MICRTSLVAQSVTLSNLEADGMEPKDIALLLSAIGDLEITFNKYTGRFIASFHQYVEVKNREDEEFLHGFVQLSDTPDEALLAMFERLKQAAIIVVDAYEDTRRELKWNGACFVERRGSEGGE